MPDTDVDTRLFHEKVADSIIPLLETARLALVEHRDRDYPNEAVGILTANGDTYPLINQARSHKRFIVSQQLVAEAISHLKYRNRLPVAVYHSHPTSTAEPSKSDESMMQEMAGAAFVIVGKDGIAAWLWDDELRFVAKIPLREDGD